LSLPCKITSSVSLSPLSKYSIFKSIHYYIPKKCVIASFGTPNRGNPEFDPSQIPSWEDHSEYDTDPALIAADTITIKNIMWNMVGLVRRKKIIERAITDLTHLEESINNFYRKASLSDELLGLRNMAQVALLVAKAALANPKSIGCHYREN
jgi:aspartate oxidase